MGGEEIDGTAHVTPGAIRRHALHQRAGLVHLGMARQLPVVEVGGERHESGFGEPVGHLLDTGVETPPLLEDEDASA